MIFLISLFILGTLGVIAYYFLSTKKNGKQIPGPFRLPILGNMLSMGKLPHIKIAEWAQKYGKIFQIGFGPYTCVIISDVKMIKEAFNDPNLCGRVDLESFNGFVGGKYGVISSDGPDWIEQRRFVMRNLREFGFGKNSMEVLIGEEVNEYLDYLKMTEGQNISVTQRFSLAVLNSLWMILASQRYPHDDPRLMKLFERNRKNAEQMANSPAMMFPKLAKMMPELSGWNKLMEFLKDTQNVTLGHITQHKDTFDGDFPRDLIDVYIKEINGTTNPNSTFYKQTGERFLNAVVQDFFFAGSDTTSSTLSWSILYLSKFPQAQKKIQAELDSVVGKNRRATLADRPNLPYTEAALLETLRMSSLAPIGFFHEATTDVTFCGYDIPKGAWICPAQHYLHYSPAIWDQPQEFMPERHLTCDGKSVTRHEALMPFSTGRRQCLGQALALDTFFLFLTAILHKYNVRLADDSKDVKVDPKPGFNLTPQNFNVVVTERL